MWQRLFDREREQLRQAERLPLGRALVRCGERSRPGRYSESCGNRGIQALLGCHARGDGESDGRRQGYNGHDDALDNILWDLPAQLLFIGVLDDAERYGLDLVALHSLQSVSMRLPLNPRGAAGHPTRAAKLPPGNLDETHLIVMARRHNDRSR